MQQQQQQTNFTTDYNQTIRTNYEVELPEVTHNNKSIVEKKQGYKVTFSPVKTRKRKQESAFHFFTR